MIILDTDHVSFLQHPDSPEAQRLRRRLDQSVDQEIATTVISAEEQMRGWLQIIARYRDPMQQIAYYDKLIDFIDFFATWTTLPLQASAVQVFHDLRKAKVRISTTDLKIAAISRDCGALLLT
jgi:tRNA(fMet)-specific endonuclease VapC